LDFTVAPSDCSLAPYHYTVDEDDWWGDQSIRRDDPDLISVVEEMGAAANGPFSELKIVEIPDDLQWGIGEYDGSEWVEEVHRCWS